MQRHRSGGVLHRFSRSRPLMPDSSRTLHRYWSGQGAIHQFRSGGVLHPFSRSRPLIPDSSDTPHRYWSNAPILESTRCSAPIQEWTRCTAPIQEWRCSAPILAEPTIDATTVIQERRCPAPILAEPTVDTTTIAVTYIDTGVEKVQCTNSGVEVSCTDSRGVDR